MVVTNKLICTTIMVFLILPQYHRHPAEVAWSYSLTMMGAEGVIADFHPPGPAFKEWGLNTNFENVNNWQGLRGHENCSRNIYSFPAWYDEEFVVTLPKVFRGKQIIFPVNGHFVFREGSHTFVDTDGDGGQQNAVACEGREVEFVRTSTADWFNPDNWIHHHTLPKGDESKSSLNEIFPLAASSEAIPHVERVPCQYDSVWFRKNSSFNLKISSSVNISKLYLGDKNLTYADLAIFFNSPLGKLQFHKEPETVFSIRDDGNETACSVGKDGDSDRCICSNYLDRNLKQKICALAKCQDEEEDKCSNPISPHGFCCSICGFHIKIRHSGSFKLYPFFTKLKHELSKAALQETSRVYITRYKEKGAHIVIRPTPTHLWDSALREKLSRLVSRLESMLKEESEVIGVTLTDSWGRAAGSGGSSDRLEGSGLGGGLITFIVFLVLAVILAGIALFIFMWNRKHGYPPLTLSSMTSALPRMSSMRIPIVPGSGSGGRRSSTLSNSLHSFGFARFTNERMSTVTISPGGETSDGTSGAPGKPEKSSSIRRADKVDDEPMPMPDGEEKVTDANSGAFGFSNVTYDLVAGVENEEERDVEESPEKKDKYPILTIPEVTVVEMPDETSRKEHPMSTGAPKVSSENGAGKEGKSTGKISKPSFVASRLAKVYQKLGAEQDESSKSGTESKKVKRKGKSAEGTFKVKRLEEEDSDDDGGDAATTAPAQVELEAQTPVDDANTVSEEQSSSTPTTVQQREPTEGELVNLEE